MEKIANDLVQDLKKRNGINKLIIGQPSLCDNVYWYYNNEPIEDNYVISFEHFCLIKSKSKYNLDENLKYLKIYEYECELEEISSLINLEYLEFGRLYLKHDRDCVEQIINLDNLKVFVCVDQYLRLNTPKLEKIKFDNIKRIQFDSNPKSVKHLITNDYDNGLEIFENLEIIELREIDRPINENLLIVFKNLKQLKIKILKFSNFSDETFNNSLIKILNDKIKLKKEIDIYLEGVKIENIDKLNELTNELIANKNSIWKFRLNNYDLLDSDLSSINQLTYHHLVKCVDNIKNHLPTTFFDKFQNINRVNVYDDVQDVDGFNWFLNNLKYLTALYIYFDVSLDEVFYNNLPITLKYLTIDNEENINYDFILNLSNLICFETEADKDLFDLAFTSFENLKYLRIFKFIYKKKQITITKSDGNFYLNYNYRRKLDYNQLIKECNKIRSILRRIFCICF